MYRENSVLFWSRIISFLISSNEGQGRFKTMINKELFKVEKDRLTLVRNIVIISKDKISLHFGYDGNTFTYWIEEKIGFRTTIPFLINTDKNYLCFDFVNAIPNERVKNLILLFNEELNSKKIIL